MSRSKKKAIYKDKRLREYHRILRRKAKQYLHEGKEIPNPKTIINDYDYSDYTFDAEYSYPESRFKEKHKRK